ncbi:aspartyl-phosphate phosphatase Spo0E family protein [Bacillus cereus]|uniref:aspartyl-phosphate phosphatase Spo0E family protein n=1 Tax=Bacillus cereus TaxID=1396 RepID=UPI0009ABB94A|nr:aspartyl-phosphate phosphatase Spo0E family protein [Bacillus cereus]MCU5086841.1 aspartyl-phosphate phosphatase Spo0E family protein [Bacillus cereus]TKH78852.1 aspartyl-phosphate phosphatase Spo0E family protein [Bacillus cereus]
MDIRVLNDTIEKRKEELIQLVIKYGFSHHKIIKVSQELDRLIYQLMRKSKIESY